MLYLSQITRYKRVLLPEKRFLNSINFEYNWDTHR